MKLDSNTWLAAYKVSFEDLHNVDLKVGPTDGIVGAVASLRIIRNGILEDMIAAEADDHAVSMVKASFRQLLEQITLHNGKSFVTKLHGFACNSSAAAASAGLKDTVQTVSALAGKSAVSE